MKWIGVTILLGALLVGCGDSATSSETAETTIVTEVSTTTSTAVSTTTSTLPPTTTTTTIDRAAVRLERCLDAIDEANETLSVILDAVESGQTTSGLGDVGFQVGELVGSTCKNVDNGVGLAVSSLLEFLSAEKADRDSLLIDAFMIGFLPPLCEVAEELNAELTLPASTVCLIDG